MSVPKTSLNHLSRRSFFHAASASAVAAALPLQLPRAAHASPATLIGDAEMLPSALDRAFLFQNFMMDAYATGSTVRLAQSYSDEALGATAFTYDNAVAIHAYLGNLDPDNLPRAEILGHGLLYAQAHNFPFNDGRFAQAYFVDKPASDGSGAYITPAAAPYYFYSSSTGDQAWAGMALAQLYARTRNSLYLRGALAVANWIVNNTYSTTGTGGFSFGATINSSNQSVPSTNGKSTEHNIDCYALFAMLARLTDNGMADNHKTWVQLATHAAIFVHEIFDVNGPYFYTGTLPDGVTINRSPIPEDCQTWAYMALLQAPYKHAIDWVQDNLAARDTAAAPHSSITGSESFKGIVFDTASLSTIADDPQAVWLEGTAHTAAAIAARVLRGGDTLNHLLKDITSALKLLEDCVHAQKLLGVGKTVGGKPIPAAHGIVAATSVMDTGFGYTYGPSLHLGATGWFLIAGFAGNPFQLGYHVLG